MLSIIWSQQIFEIIKIKSLQIPPKKIPNAPDNTPDYAPYWELQERWIVTDHPLGMKWIGFSPKSD